MIKYKFFKTMKKCIKLSIIIKLDITKLIKEMCKMLEVLETKVVVIPMFSI